MVWAFLLWDKHLYQGMHVNHALWLHQNFIEPAVSGILKGQKVIKDQSVLGWGHIHIKSGKGLLCNLVTQGKTTTLLGPFHQEGTFFPLGLTFPFHVCI